MPTLCWQGVWRTIRLASFMACRKSLPATIGRPIGRRSTIPLPQNGHGIFDFSLIATFRHRAPSRTWWYPVDMGGRTFFLGGCIGGPMSLILPFAGVGAGTAEGGGGLFGLLVKVAGFRWRWAASVGKCGSLEPGLFPCWKSSGCWNHSGIWTFGGCFECGAAGIGAADEVACFGGGGLMQPERTGSSGIAVSSSLSNRQLPILV